MDSRGKTKTIEWSTLALTAGCYAVWIGATISYAPVVENWGQPLAALMLFATASLTAAFHTSLQHEVVHDHPTPWPLVNEALIFPSLILVYPFRRYRDLHLKHHIDANLTDPYEDSESYYWPEIERHKVSRLMYYLLGMNNTFVGRMIIGTPLGLVGFVRTELARLWANEKGVRLAWILHIAGCVPVLYWVIVISGIPIWLYLLVVVYPGVAWILVRSFAEHQAAESIGGRTAIVEAHPFFGFLYLNNNLHIVHHAHPQIPWYQLPELYRQRKKQFLLANESYLFNGYWHIIRQFAFRKKQPVFHPTMHCGHGELTGGCTVSPKIQKP